MKSHHAIVPCTRRLGFTLVELLVVVAIIAILASLLLPGLHRAKSASRFAACKSQLKQEGVGLKIAIADAFEGTTDGRLRSTFDSLNRDIPYPPPPKDQRDYATESARRRHDGTLNVLFCDGHVEGMKLDRMYIDRSDAVLQRWNKDNEPHRERLQ